MRSEWYGESGATDEGHERAPWSFGFSKPRSATLSYPLSWSMPKRSLSPPLSPPAKRFELDVDSHSHISQTAPLSLQSSLYDELILCIFSHLSWVDLCAVQATNRNWSRLAKDNELWRNLYIRTFGRPRLRGGGGTFGRADGREVKPLPSRAKGLKLRDWKWMFRISSNWRKGMLSTR